MENHLQGSVAKPVEHRYSDDAAQDAIESREQTGACWEWEQTLQGQFCIYIFIIQNHYYNIFPLKQLQTHKFYRFLQRHACQVAQVGTWRKC